MSGGLHTLAHHAVRDALRRITSQALMNPRAEVAPFPTAPSLRLDLVLNSGVGAKQCLIDVALISCFTRTLPSATLQNPRLAATSYESIKRDKYGAFVSSTQELLPFVIDCCGSFSASAQLLLRRVAPAIAIRTGEHHSITKQIIVAELGAIVATHYARMILAAQPVRF